MLSASGKGKSLLKKETFSSAKRNRDKNIGERKKEI